LIAEIVQGDTLIASSSQLVVGMLPMPRRRSSRAAIKSTQPCLKAPAARHDV
jgi:hypothetical protein